MIDFLTDPLGQEFIRRALLEVGLISLAGGALGCWVIFYGVSYAAESLSHALFPGLVIAALAGIPILVGGIPGIAVAALAIALVGRVPGIGRDTAVAVVVTGFFGLGALLALSPDSPPGIQNLLFGDILAPSDSDLVIAAILAAAVMLSLVAIHWRLLAVAFDRTTAQVARNLARHSPTSRSWSCSPRRSWSPPRASARCWRWPRWSGRRRRRASSPSGSAR